MTWGRRQLVLLALVLAIGLVPRAPNGNSAGKRSIDEILSLSHTPDGFVMEAHPKLKPVDAPTRGVYFAGCVEAPKDVKDSVTQAGAAASRAGLMVASLPTTFAWDAPMSQRPPGSIQIPYQGFSSRDLARTVRRASWKEDSHRCKWSGIENP